MLVWLSVAAGVAVPSYAKETVRLELQPDHEYVLSATPQDLVLKIDLSALAGPKRGRHVPLNLAVVLDRSESMTGAKIERARQAAMGLVDRLAPGDTIALVTYSDEAQVVVPAGPIEDARSLKTRISRIEPGGCTALYAGVQLGAQEVRRFFSAERINRIILLSDGLANVGPSSTRELERLGRALAEQGLAVTTIGVGDDYNENLMAGLAEASDANYYYVRDTERLPEIFARELGELQTVAARGVRIEIVCPHGVKPIGLIGRSESFEGQKAVVSLSSLAFGQARHLFLRCRLDTPGVEVARVNLTYTDELNGGVERTQTQTATVRFTSDPARVAASAQQAVLAEEELLLTALVKEEALAEADAGRFQQAADKLARQAHALDLQARNAPAAVQSTLRVEVENLRQRSNELQQNQYSRSARKAMQSEAWNVRNAKNQ